MVSQLNVRIADDLHGDLRRRADLEDRSVGKVVERALREYLYGPVETAGERDARIGEAAEAWREAHGPVDPVVPHLPAKAVVRSGERKRPVGTQRGRADSAKCRHPITRRIGDRCGACGATVK